MIKNIIAIYPGRFQPFCKHHFESFKWLESQFGGANCYIATSDKVDSLKSPFSFKEKHEIISHYGIGSRLIQTKNPYKAEELTRNFDPDTTALVFLVGQKDMLTDPRFKIGAKKDGSPSYFQDYIQNKSNLQGLDKHGYLIIGPHVSLTVPGYGEMSGTSVRKALGDAKVTKSERIKLFKHIFGWYNEKTANTVFSKLESLQMENKTPLTISEVMKYKNSVPTNLNSNKLFSNKWWSEALELQSEGYMTPAQEKTHKLKIAKLEKFLKKTQGKPFVYDFDKFPKTVYGVKMPTQDNVNESLLFEGGSAGHMDHPFNIDGVKTGKDLLKVFLKSIEYLRKGPAAVKIDGVNTSIRLITLNNNKTFVIDRGSMKPLDVKGVTKTELTDRFGEGHGMIKIGGTVLDIFNEALPSIELELKKLGLWDNPNIMFNIEYVAGSSNVLSYGKNFLAIHGLLEIIQITPKRRGTKEIAYPKTSMQNLLNKLVGPAEERGYEVLGSIPTTLSGEPDLNAELNRKYTVDYGDKQETKTLSKWLANAIVPDTTIKTKEGKKIDALSKDVLIALSNGTPLNEYLEDPEDYSAAVDGYIIYLATMNLGKAILDKLNSPLGSVADQEGIVIRDPKISKKPFKITGNFILGGLASAFRK
jgi:hypothetical protein